MVRLVQSQKIMGSYSSLSRLSKFHTKGESFSFQYPENSKDFDKSTSLDNYIMYGFQYLACEAPSQPMIATLTYLHILPTTLERKRRVQFTVYEKYLKTQVKQRTSALQALMDLLDFLKYLFMVYKVMSVGNGLMKIQKCVISECETSQCVLLQRAHCLSTL